VRHAIGIRDGSGLIRGNVFRNLRGKPFRPFIAISISYGTHNGIPVENAMPHDIAVAENTFLNVGEQVFVEGVIALSSAPPGKAVKYALGEAENITIEGKLVPETRKARGAPPIMPLLQEMGEDGVVCCQANENASGMFGIHPRFARHFVYCGKPFFFVGKSAFALIDAEQRKDFIDEAHRDGFTVLRIWLCCPSLTKKHGSDHFHRNQAAGDLWPSGGMPEKPDFTRFNDNYFRCFDAILRDMDSRGMVAELTLFTGGDFWPGGPFVWDEVKQRYVQFILDRYKDQPNLYYEIANEYYSPEGQAFVEKVGDFIWERDKVHLVTASAGDVAQFANKPWYRLHNFHLSRGQNWWERVYHEVLIPARSHRLPMVNDEPMGSLAPDDKESDYPGRDNDASHHRMNFWITAMGGGHVTFHSHKGINALVGHSPGQEYVRPFHQFFETIRFWEMEPAPEIVKDGNAFALASPNEVIVYLPNGGGLTLDLAQMRGLLTARWFNPREGRWTAIGNLTAATSSFTAPDRSDWVLRIEAETR